MSQFRTPLVAALAVVLLSASTGTEANVITNGNFTQTNFKNNACNNQFGANYTANLATGQTQQIVGWSGYSGVSGQTDGYELWFNASTATTQSAITQWNGGVCGSGSEKLWPTGYTAPPGYTNFVGMDADPTIASGVQQTVTGLTVGQTYQLTFLWAGAQLQSRTGATTEQLKVTFGTQTQSTGVISNPNQSFTGWFYESMQFTAASASQVLSFLSIGTPTGGPPMALLAAVSMNDVPEPASAGLLVAGLAGFAAWRRRRRT